MAEIDIARVLAEKAPSLARHLPGFALRWLRRTIHEEDINYILRTFWELPPREFIHACFRTWGVTYSSEGLERLGPLWIPVNKHGAQSAAYARRYEEEFMGERPILTFPAGLCSRRIGGQVCDLPWKPNFLKKAYASQRQVVPVFVEGELSNFFYRVASLRKALGIKFNIEMLWLPDEMFSQGGKHFRIRFGEPLRMTELQAAGSLREQVEFVRKKTYFLKNSLDAGEKKR